jgi:uncharacterized membrane protein YfcA
MIWLLVVSLGVGMLIGAIGVGGILLIPALQFLAGPSIHEAMATALITFIFTGIVGTVLFQRRGSIAWTITMPVCIGAASFGFVGAWANSRMDGSLLALILSSLIIFAGIYTLCTYRAKTEAALHGRPRSQRALLLGIGAVAGFGSGLTGVGGPALSVPMMMLFGFPTLATIGASQVLQIVAAVSGTVGNLRYGSIDFALGALVTVFEIVGVYLGVKIVHAVSPRPLRAGVGVLCVLVGAALIAHSLGVF